MNVIGHFSQQIIQEVFKTGFREVRYIGCIIVIHERRHLYSCFYLLKCLQSMLKKVTDCSKNYPVFARPPRITWKCLKVLFPVVLTFTLWIQMSNGFRLSKSIHSFIHSLTHLCFINVFIDVFNLFTSFNVHVSLNSGWAVFHRYPREVKIIQHF